MTAYDRIDWHHDSAVAAGQPPEHAFAHIGLYLAWLIRHDLHDPEVFPPAHVTAVKRGGMTGSDVADDIDHKLTADVMSDEGRAFSDARYTAYLDEYGQVFATEADYSVVDDDRSYARVAPAIDRLYADWVADGRPPPAPEPDEAGEAETDEAGEPEIDGAGEPELDDLAVDGSSSGIWLEGLDEATAELAGELGGVVIGDEAPDGVPHAAPELERLVPADLTTPPMAVHSVAASDWGSSLLNWALRRLEIGPQEATVVSAMGGAGPAVLTVLIYAVPGVTADRLSAAFEPSVLQPADGHAESRDVAGRTVNWVADSEFSVASWTRDGLVVHVAGLPEAVEAAVARLP